ncbi:unnamed protein product, partial [Oppiella nova]
MALRPLMANEMPIRIKALIEMIEIQDIKHNRKIRSKEILIMRLISKTLIMALMPTKADAKIPGIDAVEAHPWLPDEIMSKNLLDLNDSSDEELNQLNLNSDFAKNYDIWRRKEEIQKLKLNQLNLNSDFAKNYDIWRRKEEIQKLKDKYGDNLDVLSDSDQSVGSGSDEDSDDDESDESIGDEQPVFDDHFFKVYSALKSRNPIIYDQNKKFFNDSSNESQTEDNNTTDDNVIKTKEKTLSLKEYHKKLIKEKKGITEEDVLQVNGFEEKPIGYYEELDQIRDEFKSVLNSEDTEEQLFEGKARPISAPKDKTLEFLNDDNIEANDSDLKYLKSYWKNEKQLEDNEKFLRDYIINKSYVDIKDKEVFRKPEFTGNELNGNSSDAEENGFDTIDDMNEDKQNGLKVSKYHFEELDALDIKRYPRNIETIRDTTNSEKRAQKRSETKDRKKKEKERELKRLRKLKKEELKERLQKFQEISGNDNMDANDLVLNELLDDENDFDSDKYDQKMMALFGDNYYYTEKTNHKKPVFEHMPEIDDYQCDEEVDDNANNAEDINDDIESKSKHNVNKKLDKKQKRIHKQMTEMGIFEDLIGGDLATRYKYRSVQSNDFGLTDEEILFSDDKELNKWLLVVVYFRHVFKHWLLVVCLFSVVVIVSKQSHHFLVVFIRIEVLKRRILKSYYEKQNDNQMNGQMDSELNSNTDNNNKKKRKRKHRKPNFTIEEMNPKTQSKPENSDKVSQKSHNLNKKKKFKGNKKQKSNVNESSHSGVSVDRLK